MQRPTHIWQHPLRLKGTTEELFVRDKDRDEWLIEQIIINNVKNFIMTFGRDF
jgi:hypothetical protein